MAVPESYRQLLWRQFRKNRAARWSVRFFLVLVLIALFGDFIANEKPIYCQLEGRHYFPVVQGFLVENGWAKWPDGMARLDWKNQPYEKLVLPLIPYSATTIDHRNSRFVGPFDEQRVASRRYWHWLGTDQIGRDVAAGMVAGTRIALLVGIISMGIASLLGILLGGLAGYFGDDRIRMSWGRLLLNLLGLYFGVFYGFLARKYQLEQQIAAGELLQGLTTSLLILLACIGVANLLAPLLNRLPVLGKQFRFPLDLVVMRVIEIMNSIPALFLILALAALIRQPSILYIMVLIGLVRWTGIARFVRSEMLRIRHKEYIEAVQLIGLADWKIMLRHALPNALTPVLITIAFGTASAILIEATLSFLGIGVASEEVTWGSLLSEARANFKAWWLAIVPGLAIFCTVTLFNLIGEGLSDAMDPD